MTKLITVVCRSIVWTFCQLLLAVVFILVVTPLGWMVRLKQDPMARRFSLSNTSYRQESNAITIKSLKKIS